LILSFQLKTKTEGNLNFFMKLAIVHDYLNQYGGAERVIETLHELYPDVSIYKYNEHTNKKI